MPDSTYATCRLRRRGAPAQLRSAAVGSCACRRRVEPAHARSRGTPRRAPAEPHHAQRGAHPGGSGCCSASRPRSRTLSTQRSTSATCATFPRDDCASRGPEPALRLVPGADGRAVLKRYPEIALEIVADSSLIDIVSEASMPGSATKKRSRRTWSRSPRPARALRVGGSAGAPQRPPNDPRTRTRITGPAVHRDALPQRRATAVGIQKEGSARSGSCRRDR